MLRAGAPARAHPLRQLQTGQGIFDPFTPAEADEAVNHRIARGIARGNSGSERTAAAGTRRSRDVRSPLIERQRR